MTRLARWLPPSAFAVVLLGASAPALADDDPPIDGATLMRSDEAPAIEFRPWRGLEARVGRELTWARWMMASDAPSLADDDTDPAASPWLDLASFSDELASLRPQAGESAITAMASLATAGLPMLGVWRGGRLRQRHVLRGYYRGRGVALAWRIEF